MTSLEGDGVLPCWTATWMWPRGSEQEEQDDQYKVILMLI